MAIHIDLSSSPAAIKELENHLSSNLYVEGYVSVRLPVIFYFYI